MTRLLVALGCLVALPRALCAQADTTELGVRLRFVQPPLALQQPLALRAAWMGAPRIPLAARGWAFDSTLNAALAAERAERALALRLRNMYGFAELPYEASDTSPRPRNLLGLPTKYADLSLDGQARLEVRTDRVREERCSPALLLDPESGCRGGFKAPSLDNQVTIQSTGLLGRRVHVNVDFDTERDYSSNNTVQIYYEGLQDEIVRRVDVGSVVFQPPPSRFITAAVPANNFGVNAAFEVGPLQFQTLAATQKGSVVAERTYTVGQTASQAQDRQVRDLDFERGRFFWVVDPDSLPGFPALDVLNLDPAQLTPTYRPSELRLYRYRAQTSRSGVNPNLGGITALGRRSDSPQQFGPVRWDLLIQGVDYFVDQSGLWITLANQLDQNDYLAVSYLTAAGTRLGTFPEVDRGVVTINGVATAQDTLELIVQPQQGPELPTFRYEMRQIYRIAGSDLDAATLTVGVTLNRSERPVSGSAQTYLQLLGLAIPSNATVFDRENRLYPRTRDPQAAQVVHDSYIIFPHLQPFADGSRLSAPETSDSLYRTPLFLLSTRGPPAKFALLLGYNSTGGGDRSTLNLNALQLREESEQLFVGGRKLVRGVDYNINYDIGQVTFLNPESLFGQGTAQVSARFEERGLFAVAPTTILGLSSRYSLGELGAVNLIGMYQREQSAFNRPALGFEASANLIGGATTELHFKPNAISRFLNHLTSTSSTAPSALDLNAEVAVSKPDPSRSGQAFLEEFEGQNGLEVSLREEQWEFGSRPQAATGVEDIGFAGGFDPADAVALTWQNLVPGGDGQSVQELHAEDIDTLIRVVGKGAPPETVMYLTLHADTAGGIVQRNNAARWSLPRRDFRPRWRSMVTSLSPTGVDLSQDEFLEFWLIQPGGEPADSAGVRMVVDLGTVSEDALALAPDSFSVSGSDTTFTGRQDVGLGALNTERTDVGIFNAATDDIGILGDFPDQLTQTGVGPGDGFPLCSRSLSSVVPLFPWGDLSSRCSRGNGVLDTEDLNGDGVLDATGATESVFRYIVDLAADSFFVRNGVTTFDAQNRPVTWKLYRIPLRRPSVVLNTPNLRLVQDLRITFVAPPDAGQPDVVARLALDRLQFTGSSWVRRAETPILGLAGSVGEPHGEIVISTVSTENKLDLGYESPPGVLEQSARRGGDRESQGTQINERSLRIVARDLRLNERAEGYLRFPSGPQNLLTYRTLRVWMRGRGPGWEEGDLQAYIRLGSDDQNFYLFRDGHHSTTWDPEFAVDLEVWRRLRADIENRWLSGQPPSGGPECGLPNSTDAFVACEGSYIVQVRDPGINPPNLAAVQEVSAGLFRVAETVTSPEYELWVDDIRVSDPVARTGVATSVDARLAASDVGSFAVSYVRQNGQFRQLNQDPSYQASHALQMSGNVRLDRFLPASLGLAVPLTVTHANSGTRPDLLSGSDLRGDALNGLRRPSSQSTTYALSIRRSQPGRGWVTKGFADPLTITGALTRGHAVTELSDARANTYNVAVNYLLQMRRRGFRLPFGGIAGGLPGWMRDGEFGKAIKGATFSLVPTRIRLTSTLNRDEATSTAYRVAVSRPEDAQLTPALALNHLWRNSAGLTWQPLGMLNLSGDLTSTRDLRVYPDSTSIGRLAYNERRFLLGVPIGVERDRNLTTALALTPALASWLRPRFLSTSQFVLSRTLSSRDPVRVDVDSGAFILPQTLNNSRSNELGASVDLSRGLLLLVGDSSALGKVVDRIRPVDMSTRLTRTSTYDLTAFDPSLGYQLALGGLDRFLQQEGSNAIGVSEARTATITSGADLPYGFAFNISHALTRTTRQQRVSDRFITTETTQHEWPVGSLRWTRSFSKGPLNLLALGTAIRRRSGNSTQVNSSGPAALTSIESFSISPDLQIGLRNGMSVTLGVTSLDQSNRSNGNETQLDQNDITGAFNYTFRLPMSISRKRQQVRSSVTFLSTIAKTCLDQSDETPCSVISDVRRREIRGGLDTDLLHTLTGGLQVGYSLNDARHLSRRTSQLSIIASFQLSLFGGDYQ